MREIRATVYGNVCKDVTQKRQPDGTITATIRLASTSQYFDNEAKTYSDRKTEYITVYARRALGRNVARSARKGDPLVVHGRISTSTWQREDGTVEHDLVVNAEAIGHDLTFGTAEFTRASRHSAPLIDERTGEVIPGQEVSDADLERSEGLEQTEGEEHRELEPVGVGASSSGAEGDSSQPPF